MKTKYAVSLGLDCAMAGLLKDAGVRAFSSPFDWLDSSDAKTRVSLIESEFKDFLNIEDLEQIFIENDPQGGWTGIEIIVQNSVSIMISEVICLLKRPIKKWLKNITVELKIF